MNKGKLAQAYQVIARLLDDAGLFETDEGQRALDYFGISDEYDEDFLPWPRDASKGEGRKKMLGKYPTPIDLLADIFLIIGAF